jgi:hypothetical protein
MNRRLSAVTVGLIALAAAYTASCRAETIIDWDAKATAVASSAALGERAHTRAYGRRAASRQNHLSHGG